jgi:hypothetical protein
VYQLTKLRLLQNIGPRAGCERTGGDDDSADLIGVVGGRGTWRRLLTFDAAAMRGRPAIAKTGWTQGLTAEGIRYKTVDLTGCMELSSDSDVSQQCTRICFGGERHGDFEVTRFNGVLESESTQVQPHHATPPGMEYKWYQGMILSEQRVEKVFDIAWIEKGSARDAENLS